MFFYCSGGKVQCQSLLKDLFKKKCSVDLLLSFCDAFDLNRSEVMVQFVQHNLRTSKPEVTKDGLVKGPEDFENKSAEMEKAFQ